MPRRPGIPLAILLQGTGAVLLLAALVVASAVLWETMPQALQVLILVSAVGVLGAVTVAARPLPATSVILAALTTASGVVVASSLPVIVPGLDQTWYPPAACGVGAVLLLVTGKPSRVAIWWHGGWIGLGLTGILAAATVLEGSSMSRGTTQWFALAAILVVAVAAPLVVAAMALAPREAEAAATSWWTALAAGGLALALSAAGASRWLTDLGTGTADGTAWLAAGFAAVAGLSYLLCVGAWLTYQPAAEGFFTGSVAFVAPLPALVLGSTEATSEASAVLAVAPTVAALAVLVLVGWRWYSRPWMLTAATGAAGVVVGTGLLVNLSVSSQPEHQAFAWLTATLTALAVALAAWSYGVATARGGWAVFGLLLGSVAWSTTWATGHLGDEIEVVTLPVLAAVLGSWWLGRSAGIWGVREVPAIVPQYLIAVALLPTLALSLTAVADGAPDQPRAWLLGAGLVGVTALAGWGRTGATLPAVVLVLFALPHTWVAVAERVSDPVPEWYALPVAAAVAVVAAGGVVDRWTHPRAAVVAVLVTGLVPSAVAVLADPAWNTLTAWRLVGVAAAGGLATVLAWRWPVVAWLAGTLAVATLLGVYVDWILGVTEPVGGGWPPPELATVPVALGIGVSVALAARAVDPRRALGVGATATLGAAALPSLLFLADDPAVEQWDTAVRLLVVLALAGIVAVLTSTAAPIRSAFAATLVVVLPLWVYFTWLSGLQSVELEAATGPLAVGAALVLGWFRRPATPLQWWSSSVLPAGLVMLIASTVWALRAPAAGIDPAAWVRMAVVAAVWAAAAVVLWRRPGPAALSGSIATLVLWTNTLLAVAETTDPPLEAITWPTALAVAVVCALVARATGRLTHSWLLAAPAVAVAAIPTAALAWQDGTVGWRVWFSLIAGGVLVWVGSWREWAGFVYPGLVVLGLVVAPVLAQWTQDLPSWVPLSLVGLTLLAIGARLEAVRRRGGQLRHWAVHLH